jgi:hypothetical protein
VRQCPSFILPRTARNSSSCRTAAAGTFQRRGEVVGAHDGVRSRVPDGNAIATMAEIGLSRSAHPDDVVLDRKIGSISREC